jgi:hypothetical protein
MGYKTKSMINAVGATYGAGNADPLLDSAAYLKSNLTDTGTALGKIASKTISDFKNKKENKTDPNPSPITNASITIAERGISDNEQSNPVIRSILGKTEPFSPPNTSGKQDFKPKDGYSFAQNVMKGLSDEGFIEKKGDGFNKGMLRKNKYNK